MTNPADEIYVIYNKETGSIKTGGGSSTRPSVHAYPTETEAWQGARRIGWYSSDRWGIAKYRLVGAKENRE